LNEIRIETSENSLSREGFQKAGASVFGVTDRMTVETARRFMMSPVKIAALHREGAYFDERKLMILQLFYELGSLTSYELAAAMLAEGIPVRLRKFSDGRSPYRRELASLTGNGMLIRYCVMEDGRCRLVFYRLAAGMKGFYARHLSAGRPPVYAASEGKVTLKTPEEHMCALSSSMFHICERLSVGKGLEMEERNLTDRVTAFSGRFKAFGVTKLLFTVRGSKGLPEAPRALLTPFLDEPGTFLVFLVPDIEAAGALFDRLKDRVGYREGRILYSTDISMKDAGEPALYSFRDDGYSVVRIDGRRGAKKSHGV